MLFYRIVETGDETQCGVCAAMDGKVFTEDEYEIGMTAPPFHKNCRGEIELVDASGERPSRDDLNKWVAEIPLLEIGFGALVGMKVDAMTGMIYHSKNHGLQLQTKFGYFDIYDVLSLIVMGFNLYSPKAEGKIKTIDKNGKLVEKTISHRIWMGDYTNSVYESMMFLLTGKHFPGKSYFGGESSILINGFYCEEDEFEQSIVIYDKHNMKMLEFDSAKMYNDRTADWVYACKYIDQQPTKIIGTIKHKNKQYIEAIAYAGDSAIRYAAPWQDENGLWCVDWEYEVGYVKIANGGVW